MVDQRHAKGYGEPVVPCSGRAAGTSAAARESGPASPIPARLHFPPVRPRVRADDPAVGADLPRAEGAHEHRIAQRSAGSTASWWHNTHVTASDRTPGRACCRESLEVGEGTRICVSLGDYWGAVQQR